MISGIIKVEASVWKIYKILFVILKIQGQTHQAAASLETIQVLALFSQRCITHAHYARYNLRVLVLTKRHVGSGNEIVCRYNWTADFSIYHKSEKYFWRALIGLLGSD